MSDVIEDVIDETATLTQPVEQVILRIRSAMQSALVDLNELVSRNHPGANDWARKLSKLMREVSGERGGRQVYGSAVARNLEPIGPVVPLAEWCDSMMKKIQAFRAEYEAAMADDASSFPAERTAADWSQELVMFVPTQVESDVDDQSSD